MELQVKKALLRLDELYKMCEDGEIALREYIICIKRLLNGAVQMFYLEFMVYERKLLWEPLDVFVEQFTEQIETAITCEDIFEKKQIIKDIENSVSEILEVYRNIVGNTSNSEQQVFITKGINTNLYEISPKKCVFYTEILKNLSHVFSEENSRDAFLLHPTIRNNIEACLLFKKREKSGRVVIIYVPEYCIEEFEILPVHLLHEAFHVLGRDLRKRKLRAYCYIQHMLLAVEQLLFKDIGIDILEKDVREQLLRFWFNDINRIISKLNETNSDSRKLYSETYTVYFLEELRKLLISVDNKIIDGIEKFYYNIDLGYNEYIKRRTTGNELSQRIRCNLFEILCNNKLEAVSNMFMNVYREGYADICCLQLLQVTPKVYEQTFDSAIHFDVKKQYTDYERKIRSMLVARTLSLQKVANVEEWKENFDVLHNEVVEIQNVEKLQTELELTEEIINIFIKYFRECADAFSIRIENVPEIEHLRREIYSIMDSKQGDILSNVFRGWNYQENSKNEGGNNIANNI